MRIITRRFISSILVLSTFLTLQAQQDYASVFVYRPKKMTSAYLNFKIYFNQLEIGQVPNGGRMEYRYYKEGRVDIMCGMYSDLGGIDKYDNSISLELVKGKSYYLKGEGKRLFQVDEDQGKREFYQAGDFKGSINLNDDKPFDYYSKKAEAEAPKKSEPEASPLQIVLSSPKLTGEDFTTQAHTLKLAGYADSKSNITSITINGESVVADEVGNFSVQQNLKEGMNRISLVMKNSGGQSTEKVIKVLREAAPEVAAAESQTKQEEVTYRGSDPFKGTNVAAVGKEVKAGKYYALLIGVDAYSGFWKPLRNAVSDAKAIEQLLRNQYRFDQFKAIYDQDATRSNIISELEWLVANVKENDNVMIYYSGHGEFKKELNKGYWVPVDAKTSSTSNYISNSDIQTFLAGIPSKHTLLVSDACFSGDIFRGSTSTVAFENSDKYYVKTYDLKSRQAISSGGIEPVMDGGKDGHSIFAYYMLQALKNNSAKYFDASQLFSNIKVPVGNNSDQSPDFNPIKNTGDEGGNFIFIRK
jgi:hypothetical protein